MQFAYTGWGELTAYTDGNNATTKFEYDPNGKLAKRVWPDGTVVKYGYANGKLVSKEEAGRKTTYAYDDYGRMIEEKIVQGKESLTTRMTYDKDSRLETVTDGKSTVRFAYDRFGRKLMEDGPVGTITMMYDGKGRLTARQVQFKNSKEKFLTEYAYDEHDRVISVKSPSGVFNYTWTKDNKIATQTIGNKKVVNTYDKAGRLTSKMFGDTVLAKYEYDELDRRVKGQYFDVKWDYSYDQYNQLTGANNSNGDSYAYTYDPIGNRLKALENGKERNFTYNSLNQISSDGYAYDAWGNMTKTPEAEYKYDLKNRLVEVKKKDGTLVNYNYDPQSQRIASVVNRRKITEFLMSGMIEYARNDGTAQYHTLGLDLLNSLIKTGAVGSILATNDQQYLYDGNGNVTASVKDNILTDKLAYEPFGKQTAGENLPFTFSTKTIDASEMSYYGYRFYDVIAGRWTNRDTMQELGGANLYGFVFSNPVSLYDFKGTTPAACADPRITILGINIVNRILIACGVTTCTWSITEVIDKKIEEFKSQCLAGMIQCALYASRNITETLTRTAEEPMSEEERCRIANHVCNTECWDETQGDPIDSTPAFFRCKHLCMSEMGCSS